jgi:hypothetical protein
MISLLFFTAPLTHSTLALRSGLALAALATTMAAKLAWPGLQAALLPSSSTLCDPAIGCTPAQLAAKRTPKPLDSYAYHSLQAAWGKSPADVELVDVVDAVLPKNGPLGAVVNLGARDGKTHDPTYPLFARGHPGAAFEGWEPIFEDLDANLGPFAPKVQVVHRYARPDTFAAELAAAGVTPANLDILKIGASSCFFSFLLEGKRGRECGCEGGCGSWPRWQADLMRLPARSGLPACGAVAWWCSRHHHWYPVMLRPHALAHPPHPP